VNERLDGFVVKWPSDSSKLTKPEKNMLHKRWRHAYLGWGPTTEWRRAREHGPTPWQCQNQSAGTGRCYPTMTG